LLEGQIFVRNDNKVYMFTQTLYGYDDFYVSNLDEFNKLLSIKLVKRLKSEDINYYQYDYLPENPRKNR